MKEERTITTFGRVPVQRLWWSAIFGGTFFAFGIMAILALFGVAIGAAAAGSQGASVGVKLWGGIWSLVTMFVSFLGGGYLAARTSGSQAKSDGRLHGLVVWGLGTVSLLYFALNTTRMAALLGLAAATQTTASVPAGSLESLTATTAGWMLIATICGLIGGLVGGHAGGYREAVSTAEIRRAA